MSTEGLASAFYWYMVGSGASREADSDYEIFFYECLPLVVGLVRRLTGSRTEAEDVAVEALGRAYANWSKLRNMPYRRAWVLRVATNLVVGQARRRRPLPKLSSDHGDESDGVVLRTVLIAALATLPRRQREAVVLRYLADQSEMDTATAMGVSAGSVKTHLSRGLHGLRSVLGDENEAGGLLSAR